MYGTLPMSADVSISSHGPQDSSKNAVSEFRNDGHRRPDAKSTTMRYVSAGSTVSVTGALEDLSI